MPQPTALIQLISEQPMPNLLPLLALRPARVVHLCTPRTALRSAQIAEGARHAGVTFDLESVQLTPMPDIQETGGAVRTAVAELRAAGLNPILNFTGGTKLMSIGAFACALREKVASLYVDTDDGLFLDGHTGPDLRVYFGDDLTFTPVARRLAVNAVVVAHGRERVTGGRDWRPFTAAARHLLTHSSEEQAMQGAIYGEAGLLPAAKEPRTPAAWLSLLDRPLALPGSVAGLVRTSGLLDFSTDTPRLPQSTRAELEALSRERVSDFRARYFAAVRPLQQAVAFFGGSWWEVCVAEAAARSGFLRDVRWSPDVGERAGFSAEEDVLALDGVRLVVISCKRGGPGRQRLVAHLAELTGHTEQIGGRFVRRFLAVARPPAGREWDALRARANEAGVRLLTPANLESSSAFAP